MSESLPNDSAKAFTFIRAYSGISGKYLMLETGLDQDRLIDALKTLVLQGLVSADLTEYPNFEKIKFYAKV